MNYGRIVFLDVDGVLNGAEWIHREQAGAIWTGPRINQEPARICHRLLRKVEAQVVLISSWRGWVNSGTMTPRGFGNMLKSHGIDADVVDALPAKDPQLGHDKDRALKLLDWLKENACQSYVVLEDFNLEPFGVKNQIRTDPRIGLVESHVDDALRLFAQQEKRFSRDILML